MINYKITLAKKKFKGTRSNILHVICSFKIVNGIVNEVDLNSLKHKLTNPHYPMF